MKTKTCKKFLTTFKQNEAFNANFILLWSDFCSFSKFLFFSDWLYLDLNEKWISVFFVLSCYCCWCFHTYFSPLCGAFLMIWFGSRCFLKALPFSNAKFSHNNKAPPWKTKIHTDTSAISFLYDLIFEDLVIQPS